MKNTTSTKWNDIKSKITMCGLLVLKDGETYDLYRSGNSLTLYKQY